jgi:hypothetical protein
MGERLDAKSASRSARILACHSLAEAPPGLACFRHGQGVLKAIGFGQPTTYRGICRSGS